MAAVDDAPPARKFMDAADITWRYGYKPDYTSVNNVYMKERTRKHKPGSLEKIVEDLVKTWEMEASHKTQIKDWGTVNPDCYTISANEGQKFDLQEEIDVGTYNMLMADSPLYDAATTSFQDSHTFFKTVFPRGFAWEILDVLSGPPRVTARWRHWGHWEGDYNDHKATSEVIELFGMLVADVDENLVIQELKIYYDPNPFLAKLTGRSPGSLACPIHSK